MIQFNKNAHGIAPVSQVWSLYALSQQHPWVSIIPAKLEVYGRIPQAASAVCKGQGGCFIMQRLFSRDICRVCRAFRGLVTAETCRTLEGCMGIMQVIAVPPLGPGETAGADVPVAQNSAMSNPAANPAIIQVYRQAHCGMPAHAANLLLTPALLCAVISAAAHTPHVQAASFMVTEASGSESVSVRRWLCATTSRESFISPPLSSLRCWPRRAAHRQMTFS